MVMRKSDKLEMLNQKMRKKNKKYIIMRNLKCLKMLNIKYCFILCKEYLDHNNKVKTIPKLYIEGKSFDEMPYFKYNQTFKKDYLSAQKADVNKMKVNYKSKNYPKMSYYIAIDTHEDYGIYDTDSQDLTKEHLPQLYNKLFQKSIQYKSRNKRLLHFIFKKDKSLIDLLKSPKYGFVDKHKQQIGDLLLGQSAWIRINEKFLFFGEPPLLKAEDINFDVCSSTIKTQKPKIKIKKIINDHVSDSDDEIMEFIPKKTQHEFKFNELDDLLSIIDLKYWTSYHTWFKLLVLLKDVKCDKDVYDLVVKYSSKCNNWCGHTEMMKQWTKVLNKKSPVKNPLTESTLYLWARETDVEKYNKHIDKYKPKKEEKVIIKSEPFNIKKLKTLIKNCENAELHAKQVSGESWNDMEDEDKKVLIKTQYRRLLNIILEYLNKYLLCVKGSEMVYMSVDYDDKGRECDRIYYKNKKSLIENYEEFNFINYDSNNIKIVNEWINYSKRRTYYKIVFQPNVYYEYKQDSKNFYNLWNGWEYKYDKDFNVDESKFKKIKNHIVEVMCNGNEDHYLYLIKLWKIILMGKKSGIGLTFTGLQGTGKSMALEYIGKKIIGERYFAYLNNLEDLTNKFSNLRVNKCFIICDELDTWSGDHKTAQMLKSLITQGLTKLERKGKDAINVEDFSNLCFLSNNSKPIKIEGKGDRRYFISETSHKYKGNQKYFDDLNIDMGNNLKVRDLTQEEKDKAYTISEHFFHYILNQDISEFNPEKIPLTEARKEMMIDYTPPVHIFFHWFLNKKTYTIKMSELHKLYKSFIKHNGFVRKFRSSSTLSKKLRKDFKIVKNNVVRRNDGKYLILDNVKSQISKTIDRLKLKYYFDEEIVNSEVSDYPINTNNFISDSDDDCMF